MNPFSKLKISLLFGGDIVILFGALVATLWFRYDEKFQTQFFDNHLQPFTLLFLVWLLAFFIIGLYDIKSLKNNYEFKKLFGYGLLSNTIIATLFFYLLPAFRITPRANLISILLIFGCADYLWRHFFNSVLSRGGATSKILMVGSNQTVQELVHSIEKNHQLGYEIKHWMKEGLQDREFNHIAQIIIANKINTVIIPMHIKKNEKSARLIYQLLVLDIEVIDVSTLYEMIFQKVPLAELEEVWFLENLVRRHKIYEISMDIIGKVFAALLLFITLPLFIIVGICIKFSSAGPIIFKQRRVGRKNQEFTIYKFRTMPIDAEKEGPRWAHYHRDPRVTWIGGILRWSHLDELPQLINILKGEAAFIGPRPERPEFVAKLQEELPFYDLRHLVKPGITGWAQIHYRYAASIEDSYQKLQYDIYYIKHNSLFLDFIVILKTLKFLVTNHS